MYAVEPPPPLLLPGAGGALQSLGCEFERCALKAQLLGGVEQTAREKIQALAGVTEHTNLGAMQLSGEGR